MFYGLAHKEEEFYADHLHKAVFFAPATLFADGEYTDFYIDALK